MVNSENGYGPRVGQSPEGYPIFLYTDPRSRVMSYVVPRWLQAP